jgi:hypothetical protein
VASHGAGNGLGLVTSHPKRQTFAASTVSGMIGGKIQLISGYFIL